MYFCQLVGFLLSQNDDHENKQYLMQILALFMQAL